MTQTTPQALLHWATEQPDAPAVTWRDRSLSYHGLASEVASLAVVLSRSGLRPGMVAGIQCDDRMLHLLLVLACEVVGAATLSLTALDLVTDAALCRMLHLLCRDSDEDLTPVDGQIRLATAEIQASLASAPPASLSLLDAPRSADTVLRIVRTSGTTGVPKLVPIRLGELAGRRATQIHSVNRAVTVRIWVTVYSFLASGGYSAMYSAFATGGHLLCHDLDSFVAVLDDLPPFVTNLMLAESSWLAERCASLAKRARKGLIQVGGGALPPSLRQALATHVVTDVTNTYSSNEAGRIAIVGSDGVGELVPGAECRILDEQGRELPLGETGIIAVRTQGMFSGYLGDPPLPGGTRVDGWEITSDIGLMPAPGRLRVLGRRDDMINIAGTKVAPHPFEDRLRTLPGVTDAILLGVPDELGVGRLLIVLEMPDRDHATVDPARVEALLPLHLGNTDLIRVTGLPRTTTGKVQRREVRDWWIAQRDRTRS